MQLCNEISMFIFLVIILHCILPYSGDNNARLSKSVFWSLLLWILYTNFSGTNELFHFEVTPWKQTCLNDHPGRCNGCCLPGYNGQAVNFAYTGDSVRHSCNPTPVNPEFLKNRVYNYSSLDHTYAPIENYSSCGYTPPDIVESYDCGCG